MVHVWSWILDGDTSFTHIFLFSILGANKRCFRGRRISSSLQGLQGNFPIGGNVGIEFWEWRRSVQVDCMGAIAHQVGVHAQRLRIATKHRSWCADVRDGWLLGSKEGLWETKPELHGFHIMELVFILSTSTFWAHNVLGAMDMWTSRLSPCLQEVWFYGTIQRRLHPIKDIGKLLEKMSSKMVTWSELCFRNVIDDGVENEVEVGDTRGGKAWRNHRNNTMQRLFRAYWEG